MLPAAKTKSMIVEFVIILITIILVYISLRNEDWRPVALVSIVLGILAYFGMETVVANLESIASLTIRKLEYIISILFIITLTIAAAIWGNRRDDNKKALAEVSMRNKAIRDIEIAGYMEKNCYPKVSEWDEYITVLAQRLSKTRLDGESFALGIAGNWGSGKTTFLRQLKSELEKTFVVLEFDPWICTNSKIIVTDFFNILNKAFPCEKELIRDIKKYVSLLSDISVIPNYTSRITELILPEDNDSITSLKGAIEEKLNNTNNRYLVLIDDLDRLEHQELFEVLRLIRITASFSNLLFVVTYDKHHIEEMLNANHISNGEHFVKKIFNTEIVLPELEPYVLPKMLIDEITRLLGEDSKIPQEISRAVFSKDNMGIYSIVSYLQNYRDVKRFAMAFATEAFNLEKRSSQEFSFDEFFWLNMLRYTDYNTYNSLRTCPTIFLTENNTILTFKDDTIKDNVTSFNILKTLFMGNVNERPANSIRYRNNFHNYFSFRVQKDKVSIAEFNQLLNSDVDNINQSIDNMWSQNRIQSLLDVLKQTQPSALQTIEAKKNYISALLSLARYTTKYYIPDIADKLNYNSYKEVERDCLGEHAESIISEMIDNARVKPGYANALLSRLHSIVCYTQGDEVPEQYSYRSIVSDEFIVKMSESLLKKIFEKTQRVISICEITKDDNLRKYLETATVNIVTDVSFDEEEPYYKCLPFKELINYFTVNKSDRLDEFMKPIEFDEEEWEYADDQRYFQDRIRTIEKIVGSMQNLKELINSCFTNTEEEKNKWIEYWKIR